MIFYWTLVVFLLFLPKNTHHTKFHDGCGREKKQTFVDLFAGCCGKG